MTSACQCELTLCLSMNTVFCLCYCIFILQLWSYTQKDENSWAMTTWSLCVSSGHSTLTT